MSSRIPTTVLRLCAVMAIFIGVARGSWAESGLQFKFKVGDEPRYVLKQTMNMEMNSESLPKAIVSKMTQTMFLKIIVDEVAADGTAKQRQTISRIQMSVDSGTPGAQKLEYDSAAAAEPTGPLAGLLLQTLKPLVGAEFRQTMNARGEISDVVVPETVVAALAKNSAIAALGSAFSADGIKNLTSQAAIVFPEKSLIVGDRWDQQIDMKMPFGKLITTRTATYTGTTDVGLERLGVHVKIDSESDPNSPVSLKITAAKGEGEILFDNKLGRVASSKLNQTMSMEVSVGGQTFQQKTEVIVVLELDETPTTPK